MDKQSTYMSDNMKQWIFYSPSKEHSELFLLPIRFMKLMEEKEMALQ